MPPGSWPAPEREVAPIARLGVQQDGVPSRGSSAEVQRSRRGKTAALGAHNASLERIDGLSAQIAKKKPAENALAPVTGVTTGEGSHHPDLATLEEESTRVFGIGGINPLLVA